MTRKLSQLSRVSSLAIAIVLTAGAAAQSFQGTPVIFSGDAFITEGATTTDIFLNSTQTVIDWTPDDNLVGNFGAINFQPTGTTATFSGSEPFAVLNRINVADPSRSIFMDGTIRSLINGTTGGSVYFYSPSGFVIGANAVINVGSLVLSASPILVNGNGEFITINNQVVFQQANPNSAITVVNGAQISSSGNGNYVALVAPRIHHQGTIRTDTSAALVAAEAATIRFDPFGLFDIEVTTGTDAATGIHIDGGTIGRNSAVEAAGNVHRAYLVAVAKNDAVTMLINNGASVGFETATSAAIEDNAVVLSGGYDLFSGDHSTTSGVSQVDLTITNATLSSMVDARISGGVALHSGEGALSFGGDVTVYGGETSSSGTGNVLIDAINGNALTIGGDLYARAFRREADGSQRGLITRLGASGGSTINVAGTVRLDSDSHGGFSETGPSPETTGGSAQVNIGNGSTLNVGGDIWVHADAYGSDGFFGGTAGNGIGGQALVMAITGNATVNVTGSVYASAQGYGGSAGECSECGVTGGNGTGGNASVHANGGSGNSITIGGEVSVYASGYGGGGDAQAGSGFGGTATLSAANNSSISVTGDSDVEAGGFGGFGFDNAGGLGRGGTARIDVNTGGTITLSGAADVVAEGLGGSTYSFSPTAIGGNGEGGIAEIYGNGGSIAITGPTYVNALAEGGYAIAGTGGNALGGRTLVGTDGGTIQLSDLTMDGSATGGDGATGGNATARVSPPTNETQPIAAALYTVNNGNIQINGTATLVGSAFGGNGSAGNGGSATAGEVDVVSYIGDIDIADLVIAVDAHGGSGGGGGRGGDAQGGVVDVAFGLGAAPIAATISLGSATILADGYGGAGGAGNEGASGGAGGAGGNGSGGGILFAASAAGGTLQSGPAIISARGEGGAGGAGGTGTAGSGGGGGAGGIGTGGSIQTGSISTDQAPGSGGGATHTTLLLDTSAVGGDGGNGGTGSTTSGGGGNGGGAFGGRATFLSRGVVVSADSVQLRANANGGNGGSGATAGNGGNARTGSIAVESKDRFGHPTQRGTLNVGTIGGTAIAVGGIGAVNGTSTAIGGSFFRVLNGDATIGSVNMTISGATYDPSFGPSFVSVRDGTANVGTFSFSTSGDLGFEGHNGSMTANSISVSAGNFVVYPDPITPALPASYSAGSFNISTGANFVTNANLASGSGLTIDAPGVINMAGATASGPIALTAMAGALTTGALSSGNAISLNATGPIATGNLGAVNDIIAQSGGNITIGNATSTAGNIDLTAGGNIVAGNLAAFGFIWLDAFGNVSFGDTNSDELEFDSGGTVTGGNIIAGTFAGGEAQGNVTFGNISVGIARSGGPSTDGFGVGITSAGNISVGNVEAAEAIGFAGLGNLATGNLNSAPGVMALIRGNMNFGSITTAANGQVYLADAQMFLDAGGPDNFDASLVLNSPPRPTSGSISIAGPVSTGLFQAAAGTSFSAAGLNAPSGIEVSAGGLITVGGAWNSGAATLTSSDIDILAAGSITAQDIELVSTNAQRTIVGDGVSLAGYTLSNAEYNRLNASSIDVIADAGLGAAPTMIIGNLSVALPSGTDVEHDFTTWNSQTGNAVGSIRIVGDMLFTGVKPTDIIDFTTQRFELDAATGQLALTGNGGALAGTVEIAASQIHVASGAILDQLAVNPQYSGYQADLNAPAAVQRPDGVLRAGSVGISFGGAPPNGLYTLYVQNTGSAANPAGFLVSQDVLLAPDGEQSFAPGSIDVVINGQIVTPSGTLTGVEVRDALVESEGDLTPFTANSTVNGCELVGPCATQGPIPPGFTPAPGIQEIITLVNQSEMPPPDFGNEDFIDDNDETTEEGASSPIEPPVPLFDTTQLSSDSDVDDPVSGSGNPALMETPPPATSQEKP